MRRGGMLEDLRRLLRYASRNSGFFARKLAGLDVGEIGSLQAFAQRVPVMRLEELVAERRGSGDPFSGRRCPQRGPAVSLQVEGDGSLPLYVSLDGRDLQPYADALQACWSLLGLGQGDRVAVFDYGNSPVSYLASSLYVPYLTRGAADSLGCITICNDGVPEMSGRAVEILKYVRPKAMFVRTECLHPFVEELRRLGLEAPRYLGCLVVEGNEQAVSEEVGRQLEASLGLPVYRLLRADLAMFLAGECPDCRRFHFPTHLYSVEVVDELQHTPVASGEPGMLVVTNRFAGTTPAIRYLTNVRASLEAKPCPRRPSDGRVRAW